MQGEEATVLVLVRDVNMEMMRWAWILEAPVRSITQSDVQMRPKE